MDIDAEKIFEEINKIDENKVEPRDYSGQEYLFDTKKTYPLITDADHEIVVELSINLLKRNNEDIDAVPEISQLYHNNYWIPLPSGSEPNEYSYSFIRHFQNAMTGAIS